MPVHKLKKNELIGSHSYTYKADSPRLICLHPPGLIPCKQDAIRGATDEHNYQALRVDGRELLYRWYGGGVIRNREQSRQQLNRRIGQALLWRGRVSRSRRCSTYENCRRELGEHR